MTKQEERDEKLSKENKCVMCGYPMPEGEEMFKFHGYSGNCPIHAKDGVN